ncbi:MAG TPA: GNAT family N-acetyltransferase [Cytophagaceae bacterium]|jgi:hypothetical protein|nr:GNAT family N-acetyltransferase [Cytophagaceae bacterium]
MSNITYRIVKVDDNETLQLIADWYLAEWNIPRNKSIQHIKSFDHDPSQFQVLMTLDGVPIATGSLAHRVGLLDIESRFTVYKNWLALVYTIPDMRHRGFGALLCDYIQNYSKNSRVKKCISSQTLQKTFIKDSDGMKWKNSL